MPLSPYCWLSISNDDDMQIAVNCAIANKGISGSSRGLSHILNALQTMPEMDVKEAWPRHGLRQRRVWNAWTQASWDLYLAAREFRSADVLISPCNVGRARRRQHHVLIMHDTMVIDRPDLYDPGFALYARLLFQSSLRHADVVLVPSRYTKGCLETRWSHTPPIMVAPWPLRTTDDGNDPVSNVERGLVGARQRPARSKHVIMVGATEPHKRHLLGIAAVSRARELSDEDLSLTIVGPPGRSEREVMAALTTVDRDRGWTSRRINVAQTELHSIYENAWLLLQPSEIEGYGLPVGEAAAVGLPAVHSGMGALSEIAPRAVRSPSDPASYADEICSLLSPDQYSHAVSESMIAAKRHSSERFAAVVAQVLLTPTS